MAESPSDRELRADIPANIIVEMPNHDGPIFLICQVTQVIQPGHSWGDLSQDAISEYIARHRLQAAPLPGRPLERKEFRSGPGL